MSKLENLKRELSDIEDEIYSLKEQRERIEESIAELNMCEELEPVALAVLNRNYNRWCSRGYFEKNLRLIDKDLDPDDDDTIEGILVACDMLVMKGTIQRKAVGRDRDYNPIYEYRITDTETIDMFEEKKP